MENDKMVLMKIHEGAMRLVASGMSVHAAVKQSVEAWHETAKRTQELVDDLRQTLNTEIAILKRQPVPDEDIDETVENRTLRLLLHMTKEDFYQMFPEKRSEGKDEQEGDTLRRETKNMVESVVRRELGQAIFEDLQKAGLLRAYPDPYPNQ